MVILRGVSWHFIAVEWHFTNSDPEHLFMCLCPSGYFLWTNVGLDLWPVFYWVDCYIYVYVLSCMNCLHVLEMNSLFLNLVANIFSPILRFVFFPSGFSVLLKSFWGSWGPFCWVLLSFSLSFFHIFPVALDPKSFYSVSSCFTLPFLLWLPYFLPFFTLFISCLCLFQLWLFLSTLYSFLSSHSPRVLWYVQRTG